MGMKYDLLITQAMRILFQESRFYYFLLAQIPKVVTKTLQAPGAVGFESGSKTVKIFLNESYLEHMTPGQLAILLEHEAGHLAFAHLEFIKNPPEGISRKILNQAQDFVINDNIKGFFENYDALMKQCEAAQAKMQALNMELVNPAITEERIEEVKKELDLLQKKNFLAFGCIAPKLAHIEELKGQRIREVSSLEIARLLAKKDPNNQSQTLDEHPDGGSSGENSNPDEIIEVPQHVIDQMLKEAADENAKSPHPGTIPGEVERRLNEMHKSKMSFRSQLKLFAQKAIGNKTRQSWSRQNRRFPGQAPGVAPDKDSKLVVWIDTSGSVWDERTQMEMAGHMKSLVKHCSNVEVLFGDTQIASKTVFKGNFSLNKLVFKGGGGTCPQFVFDYAKAVRADGVLLWTDGEVNEFNSFGIPTLVGLVTNHAREIPGYRNIRLQVA